MKQEQKLNYFEFQCIDSNIVTYHGNLLLFNGKVLTNDEKIFPVNLMCSQSKVASFSKLSEKFDINTTEERRDVARQKKLGLKYKSGIKRYSF